RPTESPPALFGLRAAPAPARRASPGGERRREHLARMDEPPPAALAHRVLVGLAQELLLDQELQGDGQGPAPAPAAPDRVGDLRAAEDQLLLAVVLHDVPPRRH